MSPISRITDSFTESPPLIQDIPRELNVAALEIFIYKQVDKEMIAYLAEKASNVIRCDSTPGSEKAEDERRQGALPPSPPQTPPNEH